MKLIEGYDSIRGMYRWTVDGMVVAEVAEEKLQELQKTRANFIIVTIFGSPVRILTNSDYFHENLERYMVAACSKILFALTNDG